MHLKTVCDKKLLPVSTVKLAYQRLPTAIVVPVIVVVVGSAVVVVVVCLSLCRVFAKKCRCC